jgi:hypothetical protein
MYMSKSQSPTTTTCNGAVVSALGLLSVLSALAQQHYAWVRIPFAALQPAWVFGRLGRGSACTIPRLHPIARPPPSCLPPAAPSSVPPSLLLSFAWRSSDCWQRILYYSPPQLVEANMRGQAGNLSENFHRSIVVVGIFFTSLLISGDKCGEDRLLQRRKRLQIGAKSSALQ